MTLVPHNVTMIEAPRRKRRGIFDPLLLFFLRSLTPPQAAGNALAGFNLSDQKKQKKFGKVQDLPSYHLKYKIQPGGSLE